MSKHFTRDFDLIHQQLLDLFGVVEKMVNDSVLAFCDRQFELAGDVIFEDRRVDTSEVSIEENCLKTLALYQPVAVELRRLTTMMKINSELERIADLACNIAERAIAMRQFKAYHAPDRLPQLAHLGISLVAKSLDSFVNLDTTMAREVIEADHDVDEMNRQIIGELVETMKMNSSVVEAALNCFSVSKHVERIGDHAANIAEDVIYLVDGEIVRHQSAQLR